MIAGARPNLTEIAPTLRAIAAQELHIPVAHVEAGIRSGEWRMPEETHRLVTDPISNGFFATSEFASEQLRRGGVVDDRILFIGNTMIDTLLARLERLRPPTLLDEAGLRPGGCFVLTLHRPAKLDDGEGFACLLDAIAAGTRGLSVVFAVQPRTAKTLQRLPARSANMLVVEPKPDLEFNHLVRHTGGVITDSGGVTKETTVLGVPCLTLRDTTERPETVTLGTNELIGTDPAALKPALDKLFDGQWKEGAIPELWDGRTGRAHRRGARSPALPVTRR
jgi:UDP-N-acetylglucosamine 2-epimerase (non-hydrolysing)